MLKKFILEKDYLEINRKLSNTANKDGIEKKVVRLMIKQGGTILVLKRAKNDHFPNMYELPGGGLKKNENIFNGAKRELEEETGLLIKKFTSISDIFDFYAASDNKKCRGYVFNVLIEKKDIVLNPFEHDEYKWVTIDEIDNLDMLSNIRAVTKKILKENL